MTMELPDSLTIGDAYGPAMAIKDQAEATAYFDALVRRSMRLYGKTRKEAESVERANLGYYAGYYGSCTAARVLRLFGTAHPIFGATQPTAEQALAAGRAMAEGRS